MVNFNTIRIYSLYIRMEFGIKNVPGIGKKKKQWKEQNYQIRKEFELLEKKKLTSKERVSQENHKTSRNKILHLKFHQKNEYLNSSPCKTLWTFLKMGKRGTQIDWSKDMEIDDDAPERWHRQTLCDRKRRRKSPCQHWGLHRCNNPGTRGEILNTAANNSNINTYHLRTKIKQNKNKKKLGRKKNWMDI